MTKEVHPYTYALLLILLVILGIGIAKRYQRNPFLWAILTLAFNCLPIFLLIWIEEKQKKKKSSPSPLRAPRLSPPPAESLVFWYYLDEKNCQQGPVPWDRIKRLWDEGILKAHSYVWNENLVEWKKAEEILKKQLEKPA